MEEKIIIIIIFAINLSNRGSNIRADFTICPCSRGLWNHITGEQECTNDSVIKNTKAPCFKSTLSLIYAILFNANCPKNTQCINIV